MSFSGHVNFVEKMILIKMHRFTRDEDVNDDGGSYDGDTSSVGKVGGGVIMKIRSLVALLR